MSQEQANATAPSLKSLMDTDLKATGKDIPPGTYGAVLVSFGEPQMMDVAPQFQKPGKPTKRAVFDAFFGVVVKNDVVIINHLMPVPAGGAVNKKSNLYKLLRALGGTDAKLFDKDGNLMPGVKLGSFFGRQCLVSVKLNAKEFPQVETVTPPMEGAKYPTLDDAKAAYLNEEGEDVPF